MEILEISRTKCFSRISKVLLCIDVPKSVLGSTKSQKGSNFVIWKGCKTNFDVWSHLRITNLLYEQISGRAGFYGHTAIKTRVFAQRNTSQHDFPRRV